MNSSELLDTFDIKYTASGENYLKVLCPFHTDVEHPSGLIHKESGRFECKTCGKKGDVFAFVAGHKGISRSAVMAQQKISKSEDIDGIPVELIEKMSEALRRSKKYMGYLLRDKGINEESVVKWNLGLLNNRT